MSEGAGGGVSVGSAQNLSLNLSKLVPDSPLIVPIIVLITSLSKLYPFRLTFIAPWNDLNTYISFLNFSFL